MKKKATTLRSFDEVDRALLELARCETLITNQETEMNDGMQKLRERCEKLTLEARQKKASIEQDVELFCLEHKDEFEKTRSKELMHGAVSFRTNPPSVRLLNRKYNWEMVIQLLKKLRMSKFIRTIEQVDKEAILTSNSIQEIGDDKLAAVGLKIDQSEQFGIEINWESITD